MNPVSLPFRSYEGGEPYIFVSYAHSDSERVFPIIRRLFDDGYRLWYDEGIDPGTEWPEEIAAHLEGCHALLLFISPRSIESHNVRREINLALNRKKRLLCVYLEETQLSAGMEMQLSLLQSIHCTYPQSEDFFSRLEKVLGPAADSTPDGQPAVVPPPAPPRADVSARPGGPGLKAEAMAAHCHHSRRRHCGCGGYCTAGDEPADRECAAFGVKFACRHLSLRSRR